MSVYNIIPIVAGVLFFLLLGLAFGIICFIINSGLKGGGKIRKLGVKSTFDFSRLCFQYALGVL